MSLKNATKDAKLTARPEIQGTFCGTRLLRSAQTVLESAYPAAQFAKHFRLIAFQGHI